MSKAEGSPRLAAPARTALPVDGPSSGPLATPGPDGAAAATRQRTVSGQRPRRPTSGGTSFRNRKAKPRGGRETGNGKGSGTAGQGGGDTDAASALAAATAGAAPASGAGSHGARDKLPPTSPRTRVESTAAARDVGAGGGTAADQTTPRLGPRKGTFGTASTGRGSSGRGLFRGAGSTGPATGFDASPQKHSGRAIAVERSPRPYKGPIQPHRPVKPGQYAKENRGGLGPGAYNTNAYPAVGPQAISKRRNAPSLSFGRSKRGVQGNDKQYIGAVHATGEINRITANAVSFDVRSSMGQQAASKKRTGSSFSFGSGPRFDYKSGISAQHSNSSVYMGKESQGPIYDVKSQFGKLHKERTPFRTGPTVRMGTSKRPDIVGDAETEIGRWRVTPGPGTYDNSNKDQALGKQTRSNRRNAPSAKIGTSLREKSHLIYFKGGDAEQYGTESPGPGAYFAKIDLAKPAATIVGFSDRFIPQEETILGKDNLSKPGPGAHAHKSSFGTQVSSRNRNPAYIGFTRDDKAKRTPSEREMDLVPAPGKYKPEASNTIGEERSITKRNDNHGFSFGLETRRRRGIAVYQPQRDPHIGQSVAPAAPAPPPRMFDNY